MTVRRDSYGRIKRTEGSRDFRRAHLQGAIRMVDQQKRTVDSFSGRMLALLRRAFQ